jgi:hypothetical protein
MNSVTVFSQLNCAMQSETELMRREIVIVQIPKIIHGFMDIHYKILKFFMCNFFTDHCGHF